MANSITSSIKNFFIGEFNGNPEMLRKIGSLQLYIFLVILTLLVIKPTAYSLFISEYGVDELPTAYIFTAILAAVFSTLYAKLLNFYNLKKLIYITLILCVLSFILFGVLLDRAIYQNIILYVLYLFVMLFALVTTSQFWMLANLVFNSREAKQAFGLIGAGAIAGGIFGGYLASFLTNFLASKHLLYVAAISISPCIFLLGRIWNNAVSERYKLVEVPSNSSAPENYQHPAYLIYESPHLTYLAMIVGLSVLVAKLVDYQFSDLASSVYVNEDDLTSFFGFWFSTFNVVSLLLQIFFTKRIMESLGVSRALYLLPGLLLLVASAMVFFPEVLMIAIFLKLIDGSLKQSVNKAAMELLILPVPMQIKNSTKTFIDVFIDSLATGIAGLLLIFVIKGIGVASWVISLIIIVLTLIWLVMIVKIRNEYLKAFKRKINDSPNVIINIKDPEITPSLLPFKKLRKKFTQVIKNGSEKELLEILKFLRPLRKKALYQKTEKLLTHPSPKVRVAAIKNINRYKKAEAVDIMEEMLLDESVEVQAEALAYLMDHDKENSLALVEEYLEDPHYKIRGVALVQLAKLSIKDPSLTKKFKLENRLYYWYKKIGRTGNMENKIYRLIIFLQTIGKGKMKDYYGYIRQYLNDPSVRIRKAALLAAGATKEPYFLEDLFKALKSPQYRNTAIQAISLYKEKSIPKIKEALYDEDVPLRLKKQLTGLMSKTKTQNSVDFLTELLEHPDLPIRQKSLQALNQLKSKKPELNFDYDKYSDRLLEEIDAYRNLFSLLLIEQENMETLKEENRLKWSTRLIDALKDRLDFKMERIFLILGLKYDPNDMWTAYQGVKSDQVDMRINSLEFLENLLTLDLKKLIIPLVEMSTFDNLTQEAIDRLEITLPSTEEAVQMALQTNDKKLAKMIFKVYPEFKTTT